MSMSPAGEDIFIQPQHRRVMQELMRVKEQWPSCILHTEVSRMIASTLNSRRRIGLPPNETTVLNCRGSECGILFSTHLTSQLCSHECEKIMLSWTWCYTYNIELTICCDRVKTCSTHQKLFLLDLIPAKIYTPNLKLLFDAGCWVRDLKEVQSS